MLPINYQNRSEIIKKLPDISDKILKRKVKEFFNLIHYEIKNLCYKRGENFTEDPARDIRVVSAKQSNENSCNIL